jgi:hypothetical protein
MLASRSKRQYGRARQCASRYDAAQALSVELLSWEGEVQVSPQSRWRVWVLSTTQHTRSTSGMGLIFNSRGRGSQAYSYELGVFIFASRSMSGWIRMPKTDAATRCS